MNISDVYSSWVLSKSGEWQNSIGMNERYERSVIRSAIVKGIKEFYVQFY